MKKEFLSPDDYYQIWKEGKIFVEAAYWLGFDGECHVFANANGVNHKIYISNLNNYAFATDL